MTITTKKIDITPDKTIYPKFGRTGYTIAQALSELIDNSIDARDEHLEINIKVDRHKGVILVEDNGLGMSEDVAANSIRLGSSSKKEGELGQFGIGLKAACMSLGKRFTVQTSPKGSSEIYILEFDEDNFATTGDWKDFPIRIKKGVEKDQSFTKITIEKLKIKFYPNLFDILKKHLSERFTPFIQNGEVLINFNGERIRAESLEIFPDSKKDFTVKLSNGEAVKGWTGILKRGSVEASGFNLYRYKRLIRAHEKLGYVYHPSKMAITGEIYMDPLPVTINKREFETENEYYIEFFQKFSEYLKPILAEVQKRHQEDKIKDLPREIKETLKDNLLKALNKTDELKELAFPGRETKKRSQDDSGELDEKETRDASDTDIGVVESGGEKQKGRTPQKTQPIKTRFITIAGHRYRFDYTWGALEASTPKEAYLDRETGTIMVVLNSHYQMLKVLPRPDIFYHVIFLTEGIIEVFLRENKLSLEKVINLRDKLTQQLADIMSEDIVSDNATKDSQIIEAQTYLLKGSRVKFVITENERFVLERRLEEGKTYKAIAAELRISLPRVQQIFRAGVAKISQISQSNTSLKAQGHRVGLSETNKKAIDLIIKGTARTYGVKTKDLLGRARKANLVLPRHTAMYLLRKELNLSFPRIAGIIGNRDHTTVMYAYRKMEKRIGGSAE